MSSPTIPGAATTKRAAGRRVLDQDARTNKMSVLLTNEEVAELDRWLHERQLPTRSDAIRTLMRLGYESKDEERRYG